ncbi:FxsA family protein [Halalkalicoccus salilacus]|uniref:FxsA family protein n=1 Tax=Halalkalicoccus salilacus TaxID=3117459 RepID=UPI00300ECB5C
MWKRLLVALLIIPLLDAIFLIVVADWLSWPVTVLLVVLTALLGTLFVQAEGRHTIRRFQGAIGEGRLPADELLDGGFLIAAGALLLTPGLLTDAIGFLFVLPPSRYVFRGVLKRWVITPYLERKTDGFVSGDVYTFGFPNPNEGDSDGGTVDLGSESYDVHDEGGS